MATLLLILASANAGAIMAGWCVCMEGFSAACAAMTRSESHWMLPSISWVAGITTATAGLFIAHRKKSAIMATGILLVVNPLTDTGAFFLHWDTADTLPFTGAWISMATVLAAVLLLSSASPPTSGPPSDRKYTHQDHGRNASPVDIPT